MTNTVQSSFELPMTIPVDTEHIGIRTFLPILAIGGAVGGFILGRIITPLIDENLGSLCFSMILAVMGFVLVSQLGEQILKRIWGSGRHLELSEQDLMVNDKRQGKTGDFRFVWDQGVDVAGFYWEVETRKSRVQQGWYCVAAHITQRDNELIIYSFLPPDDAKDINDFRDYFFRLLPKKTREELVNTDPREAAVQERYRRLESQRWFDGAELHNDHFMLMLEMLHKHGTFRREN